MGSPVASSTTTTIVVPLERIAQIFSWFHPMRFHDYNTVPTTHHPVDIHSTYYFRFPERLLWILCFLGVDQVYGMWTIVSDVEPEGYLALFHIDFCTSFERLWDYGKPKRTISFVQVAKQCPSLIVGVANDISPSKVIEFVEIFKTRRVECWDIFRVGD